MAIPCSLALVITGALSGSEWPSRLAAVAVFVAIAACFGQLRPITRFYVVVLLAATVITLLLFPDGMAAVGKGLSAAAVFAAFMLSVTLIRHAVQQHPALESIRTGVKALDAGDRRGGVFVVSHILGSVLTFGSLAVVAPILGDTEDETERRDNAALVLRAVGLVVFWSPFSVAIAMVLQSLPNLPAWLAFASGVGIVAAGVGLSVLLGDIRLTLRGITGALTAMRPLLLPIAVSLAATFALPVLFGLQSLVSAALVIPVFCSAWLFMSGGGDAVHHAWSASTAQLDLVMDEISFFSCSILLGNVIAGSSTLMELMAQTFALDHPGFVHIAAGGAVIMVVCSLGIHMVVPASIVLAVLGLHLEGTGPQLAFALVVLYAWAFSVSTTVASVAMLATSNAFRVPLRRLILGPNLPLTGALGVLILTAAYVLTGMP